MIICRACPIEEDVVSVSVSVPGYLYTSTKQSKQHSKTKLYIRCVEQKLLKYRKIA